MESLEQLGLLDLAYSHCLGGLCIIMGNNILLVVCYVAIVLSWSVFVRWWAVFSHNSSSSRNFLPVLPEGFTFAPAL